MTVPRRPDGRDAVPIRSVAGASALITSLFMLAVNISVVTSIVMLGTDYLHNGIPAVPELGFIQAFVACCTARALFGNRNAA